MSRINTNVSSLVGRNNLNQANANLAQSLTRLSTGLRINTGADDPAGLIASENLRSDITSIERAISNTDRASQVIATADSALGQVSSLLNDIRGLVTESANAGALSDEQIAANQLQVDSSLEALNRIAQTTEFQGRRLLDGSLDFLTTAGTNSTNISNLQIDQANLGATGSVAVDVEVTTAATQASVDVTGIPVAGTTPAQATANLDFTLNQAATASAVTAGGAFAVDTAAAAATGTFTLTNGNFDISAATAGSAGNNADINVVIADNTTGLGAVFNGTDTITVTLDITNDAANSQVSDVAAAIDADLGAQFVTSNVTSSGVAVDAEATTGGALANGVDAQVDFASTFSAAASDGDNFDVVFTVADTGTGTGITVGGTTDSGTVTVELGAAFNGDLDSIATAITGAGVGVTSAAFTDGSTVLDVTEGDNATAVEQTVTVGGGVAAVAGTLALDVQTTSQTDAFNGFTINATSTAGGANTATATLNTTTNAIDLAIVGDVTGQDIVDAINSLADFTASLDATNSGTGIDLTSSFVQASDSVPGSAPAFAGGVNDEGIDDAVVFELSGADGAEVLSFGIGSSVADIVAGINLVSDATGVTATDGGSGTLNLTSSAFGADAFVDINIISEGTGTNPAGVFTDDLGQGERNAGTDVVASVNGVEATGDGNDISINTATLDLSLTLDSAFTGTASFTVTGGGALFQLGPDVVSNQQARLGIGSVNTARLGGTSGLLFQLGTGGTADLSTDATTAANIVEEAINQVTSLRGRLGAFQRTTLETNQNALNDTLANLTEAESSIRDADFAAETAELTRSQILVQAGTQVLAIANQNPQNVLALLG